MTTETFDASALDVPTETVRRTPLMHHDSPTDEVNKLWLTNLLLTIVTLGIYSFWATARERRLLWSHTQLLGERLEYTGTGGELFRGFLVVLVVFILPFSILYFLAQLPDLEYLGGVAFAYFGVMMLLTPLAVYWASRYLLSRTVWRGVRFGLVGSAKRYWLIMLGQYLLIVVTLGLWWPKAIDLSARLLWADTHIGSAPVTVRDNRPPLIGKYLLATLAVVFGVGGLLFLIGYALISSRVDPLLLVGFGFFSYLALMIGTLVVFAIVKVTIYEALARDISVAGITPSCTITVKGFVFTTLKAFGMLFVTAGTGAIFVRRMWIAYFTENLTYNGTPDYARIGQGEAADGAMAEALLDEVDVGGSFGM